MTFYCLNQQDPWVTAVVMEGKMQLSSWGISACFIFWGPYKKNSVSMIGTGNYFSFITIPLGLDLTHYHYTLHLPRLMKKKKKKKVSCMLWIMLIHEIEGEKTVKCISTQCLCPGEKNGVFLSQICSRLPFFSAVFLHAEGTTNVWSPALFSFLHVLQAETDGNLKLLASASGSD